MYTKQNAFFGIVNYYRDGVHIGYRRFDGPLQLSNRRRYELRSSGNPCELTRAQGYRYWLKHFPGRCCFDLPPLLLEATAKPCQTYGNYVNRNGERVGYAG